MTDLADPPPQSMTSTSRLEPVVFAHARLALLTATVAGMIVDVNPAGIELLARPRHGLVQEPLSGHLTLLSGLPLVACLHEAARSADALSFGPCSVRRRSGAAVARELVVSSGCRASGRELLLVQLAPMSPHR